MGFKANIDIALSFSSLRICSIKQQGRIRFRVCLYYTCRTKNVFVPTCRKRVALRKSNFAILTASSGNQHNRKATRMA